MVIGQNDDTRVHNGVRSGFARREAERLDGIATHNRIPAPKNRLGKQCSKLSAKFTSRAGTDERGLRPALKSDPQNCDDRRRYHGGVLENE